MTILNAAPILMGDTPFLLELLRYVDYLVVNESEAVWTTGIAVTDEPASDPRQTHLTQMEWLLCEAAKHGNDTMVDSAYPILL